MADGTKLSELTTTTETSGGYVYIILPNQSGGYDSFKILASGLAKALNPAIKLSSISGDITYSVSANTMLTKLFCEATYGTPTIKIGTTLAGSEIMGEITVSTYSYVDITAYLSGATTLYISVSGGTLDLRIDKIDTVK